MDAVLGVVTINESVVGTFSVDEDERIIITPQNEDTSVLDMLEYATENGMSVGLVWQPEYEGYLPKHLQDA